VETVVATVGVVPAARMAKLLKPLNIYPPCSFS